MSDDEARIERHRHQWLTGAVVALGLAIGAVFVWLQSEAPPETQTTATSVSARVRLITRLAEAGREDEARAEGRALLERAPGFSARRWVSEAYEGVRREEDREAQIALLVRMGLPE